MNTGAGLVRFDLKDRNRIHIQGTWMPGSALQVMLDGKEIPASITLFIPGGGHTPWRIAFTAVLPENCREKSRLQVFRKDGDGKTLWYAETIRSLRKQDLRPRYFIDSSILSPADGTCIIRGWAAAGQQISIAVETRSGEQIPFRMESEDREDVRREYSSSENAEVTGFQIYFPYAGLEEAVVVFSADGRTNRYIVPFSRSRVIRNRISAAAGKAAAKLREQGAVKKLLQRQQKERPAQTYMEWLEKHLPDEKTLDRQRKTEFAWMPKFSIVIPLYRTPEVFLDALVESVRGQTYPNWELCLSDGSGKDSPLKDYLEVLQRKDSRIKVVSHDRQLRISENTNAAIGIAEGDFIVFADHDDLLVADSLFECAAALNENREIEMIYTDEDKVSMDGKEFFQPHFKSDYNPDLLRTNNYICHLCVVKRGLVERSGLLRPEFDGSQDFDFVLRCTENTDEKKIHHIPRILYHWRTHQGSTAENPESKMYAFDAGMRAIQAHYDRTGIRARAAFTD